MANGNLATKFIIIFIYERSNQMIKNKKPELKNEYNLTMEDEINAINEIADMFFQEKTDEEGNVSSEYTPYYEKLGQINAIAKYFIQGIEFEPREDIYNAVMQDKDIRPLIDEVMLPYKEKVSDLTFQQKIFIDVMDKVYDIVEYRKAVNIAKIQNQSN